MLNFSMFCLKNGFSTKGYSSSILSPFFALHAFNQLSIYKMIDRNLALFF